MVTAYLVAVALGGVLLTLGGTVPAIFCIGVAAILVLRYELLMLLRIFAERSDDAPQAQ